MVDTYYQESHDKKYFITQAYYATDNLSLYIPWFMFHLNCSQVYLGKWPHASSHHKHDGIYDMATWLILPPHLTISYVAPRRRSENIFRAKRSTILFQSIVFHMVISTFLSHYSNLSVVYQVNRISFRTLFYLRQLRWEVIIIFLLWKL